MIDYLIGQISRMEEDQLILENSGIGYSLTASSQSMAHFHVGETHKIYTVLVLREDALQLYGFYSLRERELFGLLTKVSAVGPKSAIAILSALDEQALTSAILNNDINALTKAPGVGKKTASRIILELVDPLKKAGFLPLPKVKKTQEKEFSEKFAVALEALMNLGYGRNEAEQALSGLDENLSLEKAIRLALQNLS